MLGGAWFVVGRAFAPTLGIGDVGQPAAAADLKRALLEVTYFTGLGALIVFLGGAAVARLAVRHARDVVVTQPAPAAGDAAVPAAQPAMYDETGGMAPARTDAVPADAAPRERGGHGLFHRRPGGLFHRHHAGV